MVFRTCLSIVCMSSGKVSIYSSMELILLFIRTPYTLLYMQLCGIQEQHRVDLMKSYQCLIPKSERQRARPRVSLRNDRRSKIQFCSNVINCTHWGCHQPGAGALYKVTHQQFVFT